MYDCLSFYTKWRKDDFTCRLHEIGNKDTSAFQSRIESADDLIPSLEGILAKKKCSHCSFCGHPGSKRDHFKYSCEHCSTSTSEGCKKKPEGFKCDCMSCDVVCTLALPVLYSHFLYISCIFGPWRALWMAGSKRKREEEIWRLVGKSSQQDCNGAKLPQWRDYRDVFVRQPWFFHRFASFLSCSTFINLIRFKIPFQHL